MEIQLTCQEAAEEIVKGYGLNKKEKDLLDVEKRKTLRAFAKLYEQHRERF